MAGSATVSSDFLSLSEVAFLLGYSEQSGFNHAFRRWTGSTPRRHRARLAKNAP